MTTRNTARTLAATLLLCSALLPATQALADDAITASIAVEARSNYFAALGPTLAKGWMATVSPTVSYRNVYASVWAIKGIEDGNDAGFGTEEDYTVGWADSYQLRNGDSISAGISTTYYRLHGMDMWGPSMSATYSTAGGASLGALYEHMFHSGKDDGYLRLQASYALALGDDITLTPALQHYVVRNLPDYTAVETGITAKLTDSARVTVRYRRSIAGRGDSNFLGIGASTTF